MPENEMTGNIFYLARRQTNVGGDAAAPPPEKVTAEALLVKRVCDGDGTAFNELYKIFAPLVHGIILARVPRGEVDDLVQEVFLSAYKNAASLRNRNAVGAWLAMIARRRAAEFYRQARPTEEISEDLRCGGSDDGSAQTEAREILRAIRALPETYSETLVLRLVEGMSGQEIAERTGLKHESVRVNLHRGMKLLREKLGVKE
jgi:RNA polymerase sigma-70 factor (ECF subfamily)